MPHHGREVAFALKLKGEAAKSAQKLARKLYEAFIALDVGDALGQPYAALGLRGEFGELALAASAGVDLRLHHVERPGQLLRRRDGFGHGHRRISGRHGDPVLGEQFLGLVFVNVHGEC